MATEHKCPACDKTFKTKGGLTAHARSEHGDSAIVELMTKYGAMSPRPGGAWRPERPLTAAPSGVPSIDYAIGIGGVPRGTLIEVFGPPASGKTLTALTFAAFTQKHGGLAGYVDAEHRLQPTFAKLVSDLNLDTLYYSEPDGGEAALNMTKDFVKTGLYDVWIVDSVHGCVPKALRDKEIGDNTMAELAKLMSAGCQVLEPIVSETNTVVIFVNHVKAKPGVLYGKDWSKPGGSALDYYASVQLQVQPFAIFQDTEKRKIGHSVRVKVENSKVAAPYASATYDIFYKEGKIVKADHERNGQEVVPGIDIASCWFSVCEESGLIVKDTVGRWVDTETGEHLGYKKDILKMLQTEGELTRKAYNKVYGAYGSLTKRSNDSLWQPEEPIAVG
jgi:recombination protein RecA